MDPLADSKTLLGHLNLLNVFSSSGPRVPLTVAAGALVLAPLAVMSDQEPTTSQNGELSPLPLLGERVAQDPTSLPRGPTFGFGAAPVGANDVYVHTCLTSTRYAGSLQAH